MSTTRTKNLLHISEETKPADLVQTLKTFEPYQNVDDKTLQWLVDHSTFLHCPAGKPFYLPGSPVDSMDTILVGSVSVFLQQNNGTRQLGEFGRGYVMGVLPFSRMKTTSATLIASGDLYVLSTPKACFTDMVLQSYQLVQNLVAVMSTRIRTFADKRNIDEKMMSLGKLSAGLAHELNNPSAAIVRSADELYTQVRYTPDSFKRVMSMNVTPMMVDQINEIMFARVATLNEFDTRSALEQMDAVEALEDWFEDQVIEIDPETLDALNQAKFTDSDLDQIADIAAGADFSVLIEWIAKNIALEKLVVEIREASTRISELVGSVKSYTHMDRDAGMESVDLKEGLHSTVVMLKHKFKRKNVALVEELAPNLPLVKAWGGQLNQVYTNLIDNAIDAAGDGGSVIVKAFANGGSVCVEIIDDGPGVPEELKEKIFDPFFTTKDVGEGTGMGLDITKKILEQHNAPLELESEPGKTIFRICLPAEQ